jgi:predicted MFS family arabinose efflux permease
MMSTITTGRCVAREGEADDRAARSDGLSKGMTLIFAAVCGISVANIYYAQPLLDVMGADLGIAPSAVGLVVTLTQLGYALGLIFIVPLGDLVDRRRLVIWQATISGLALMVVATAQSEAVMLAGAALVGSMSVVIQVLVAFAATLAVPAKRGNAVGTVTSGVVIGILAARFVAGVLADFGGWRAVYFSSAAATFVMAAILWRILPRHRMVDRTENYIAILRSVPAFFIAEPVLRMRGLLALLIFATFSTFWTALVLPLSAQPFSLSHTVIGLFGLVGVAGALAANGAGRLADRGFGGRTTSVALTLLLASWGLIVLLPMSVVALVIGVILLDLAVQAVHVTNQSIIFARFPDARSRLVGGYMLFYSIGSGVGAIASTAIYALAGWSGVSLLGAGFSATALAIWTMARDR